MSVERGNFSGSSVTAPGMATALEVKCCILRLVNAPSGLKKVIIDLFALLLLSCCWLDVEKDQVRIPDHNNGSPG